MIDLKQLAGIVQAKEEFKINEEARIKKEYDEKTEKEYQEIVLNLQQRLIDAANEGERRISVAHFSAFGFDGVSDELHAKRGSHGNYYVAWNKSVFESDVIECMQGNFKRVYDYLNENKLNPKIEYWTDGGGMDEGFQLVVSW